MAHVVCTNILEALQQWKTMQNSLKLVTVPCVQAKLTLNGNAR